MFEGGNFCGITQHSYSKKVSSFNLTVISCFFHQAGCSYRLDGNRHPIYFISDHELNKNVLRKKKLAQVLPLLILNFEQRHITLAFIFLKLSTINYWTNYQQQPFCKRERPINLSYDKTVVVRFQITQWKECHVTKTNQDIFNYVHFFQLKVYS